MCQQRFAFCNGGSGNSGGDGVSGGRGILTVAKKKTGNIFEVAKTYEDII